MNIVVKYSIDISMKAQETINDVLVNLFNEIMQLEEEAIITEEFKDLTNNDMHVIEAVGNEEGNNMSTIAKKLKITVGSLTIAMNSLVRKGYVVRERSEKDRRVVNIKLTDLGKNAYNHHEKFHKAMVNAVMEHLSTEEVDLLAGSLEKLRKFFRGYNQ